MTPSDLLIDNLTKPQQAVVHKEKELLEEIDLFSYQRQPILGSIQEEISGYMEAEQTHRFTYLAQLHGKYILL